MNIDNVVDEIILLFRKHGDNMYIGENVSNTEHAVQAALHAEKNNMPRNVIIAAFLHDIGHYLASDSMNGYGVINHEDIGYNYLLNVGFKNDVAVLVKNHVNAKRYMVSVNKEYRNKLSDASKITLGFQGGIMKDEERDNFEKDPLLNEYIMVRLCDDAGKVKDLLNQKELMEMFDKYINMVKMYLSEKVEVFNG